LTNACHCHPVEPHEFILKNFILFYNHRNCILPLYLGLPISFPLSSLDYIFIIVLNKRNFNDYIHMFHKLCVLLCCSMLYNLEFGREMDSVRAHEDAVSCLSWGSKNQVLVSGSWDCSVRVWQGMADGRRIKPSSSLIAQFDHDAHITCLSLTR